MPPIKLTDDELDAVLAAAWPLDAYVRDAFLQEVACELGQAGLETDCAVSMLRALETCLRAFERHRETVLEQCVG